MTLPDMIEKISSAWNKCSFKTKAIIVISIALLIFIL
ncbi:hypothetical protein [uncultured phage_Deep1-GF2-KM23-C739]|uniref:Uncharacterized protein n=1 Tax=uncultured phage_Deep1-GF2-KM23-C739 TaxID=2740798 RepID=A0A1B1IW14_9CAUD|nr:hypothetical protein HOU05_gp36 [uncultured phage_Deep1-GF2-KM23-C739]ANS05506.1 hypothetical protein [uncultured phage_Deep1-GF2-KM23-C739]